ncbi:hypothetical protein TeGR_g6313 [Tetraparma gracilis]|uniref:Cytochrome b5 heme-binding domain-containing protein n=1 Tax=Tetraparma gracilis TaxID=2962635 RepID=A0ABQ6MSH5_9STRA|nr:hypothetical protein TeGR_g6313 [Tetraparma gracilis]
MSSFSAPSSAAAAATAPSLPSPSPLPSSQADSQAEEARPYCDTMPPPRPVAPAASAAIPANPKVSARKPAVSPRQKFRLAPGFGLMDWVRLKAASPDLAQRGGASPSRPVPRSELAEHGSQFDGWIALRGVVYNVSAYLPYHPGGAKVMLPTLGGDATAEFDKFHRWVAIEGLVGVLRVGVLVED